MIPNLVDFFRCYAIPPSPLHKAIQEAAKKAGWMPPWENEEQRVKKSVAGKRSGASRAGLASLRQSFIKIARTRLKLNHRSHPFTNDAIAALREEYIKLLVDGGGHLIAEIILEKLPKVDLEKLKRISDDTLIKDLKVLRRQERT